MNSTNEGKIKMDYSAMITSPIAMEVLNEKQIDEVSGGLVPIAMLVWYTSGFIAGAAGGWAFGTTVWK